MRQNNLAMLSLAFSIVSATVSAARADQCPAPVEPAASAFARIADPNLGSVRDYLVAHPVPAATVDALCHTLYSAAIAAKNDALVLDLEAAGYAPASVRDRVSGEYFRNYYEFALGHGGLATIRRLKIRLDHTPLRAGEKQTWWNDLIFAVRDNSPDVVDALISAGEDPNGVDGQGVTVLAHAAFASNDPAVIDLLVRRGARIDENVGNEYVETALMMSVSNSNPKVLEALLRNGATVDGTGFHGKTALLLAGRSGNLAAVERLIKAGANVNATMVGGATVLMHSAFSGSVPVIEALLKAGAKVNARTDDGATALFFAIEAPKNVKAEIETLLRAGADKTLVMTNGTTAYDLADARARSEDREAILALLALKSK